MGNTCKPMAVSFQCMTKSTTNKKKIKIKNKKKFKKKLITKGSILTYIKLTWKTKQHENGLGLKYVFILKIKYQVYFYRKN